MISKFLQAMFENIEQFSFLRMFSLYRCFLCLHLIAMFCVYHKMFGIKMLLVEQILQHLITRSIVHVVINYDIVKVRSHNRKPLDPSRSRISWNTCIAMETKCQKVPTIVVIV